jgi:hypothetical protein
VNRKAWNLFDFENDRVYTKVWALSLPLMEFIDLLRKSGGEEYASSK